MFNKSELLRDGRTLLSFIDNKGLFNGKAVDFVGATILDSLEDNGTYRWLLLVSDIDTVELQLDGVTFHSFNTTATSNSLKIYHYMKRLGEGFDNHEVPKDIDFNKSLEIRLHPETEPYIVQGELQKTIYYSDVTINQDGSQTFSNPVIEEVFTYIRTPEHFAVKRIHEIKWYNEDGTLNPDTKIIEKFYSPQDSIVEGKRRRGNIVSRLTMLTFGILQSLNLGTGTEIIAMGQAFMNLHKSSIETYQLTGDPQLVADVQNDITTTWLNDVIDVNGTTVRQVILNEINIFT